MLKVSHLTKKFSGNFTATLTDVDFELEKGEFCIVIGSNGSGKSTLLKCILGEEKIDQGDISKHNIAIVMQDVSKGTIPEMTCLENIILSRIRNRAASFKFYHKQEDEIKRELKELDLGLENYINKPLFEMSGGQRQVIATMMAITSNPEILLLDEHTSALDPKTQKLLMEYTIKKIEQQNLTTIMVTHKLDEAVRYGNRLIMLHQGKIILDVKSDKKRKLSADDLFQLFHKCEVNND
jgi:putative tryptophan/tyrosine transport system ATP-binding protein